MSNEQLTKNQEYYKVFDEKIKLTSSPVAMKFVDSEDEVPEGIELISEKVRHCEMVKKASFGEIFYSTYEEQTCKGGAGALGLGDMPEKLASGEKYQSLGRFKDLDVAKKTVDKLSIIPDKKWGIVYAPLEKANFAPDVVLIIAQPVAGMKIAQSIVFTLGDKVRANFAGIQSLCGDAVSYPYIEKDINITVGCDGSRKAAKVLDEELAIGISADKLDEVIENLQLMK